MRPSGAMQWRISVLTPTPLALRSAAGPTFGTGENIVGALSAATVKERDLRWREGGPGRLRKVTEGPRPTAPYTPPSHWQTSLERGGDPSSDRAGQQSTSDMLNGA